MRGKLFRSFFMGGFECSTHVLRSGKRLDMVAATGHDIYAVQDYRRLRELGIEVARDGIRWHLIEQTPGRYNFSSALPIVRAARDAGVQVIWDLCHYGWPTYLGSEGVFTVEFIRRFAGLARSFTHILREETDSVPYIAPINEISFFAWAGGDAGYLNPFANKRAEELKVHLTRASIEAIEAIWSGHKGARIFYPDPVIHIIPGSRNPQERAGAEGHRMAQYEAWDMLCGRRWPGLGGDPKYLDVIGVNFYPNNQWVSAGGPHLRPGDRRYRPFRNMLGDVYKRYGRPMFVAETGAEGDARPGWLRYVAREVRAAMRAGVPMEGICLYPIVNHPGWDNDRHCHNGLWDYPDTQGMREVYGPLAREIKVQARLVNALCNGNSNGNGNGSPDVEADAPADRPNQELVANRW